MKTPVIEADKTRTDKNIAICSSDVGVGPVISLGYGQRKKAYQRKRAYHRALKRGDPGAVAYRSMINMLHNLYAPRILYEMNESPFMKPFNK